VAQQERGHGEIPPGRRVARSGLDRFTVRGDGLLVPARGIEGDAEVVARIGINGAELSGSPELVDRGRPGAKVAEGHPKVVVGVSVGGVDEQRLPIRLCSLVPPMQVGERRTQARVDRGNARGEPRGGSESLHSILVAAATQQLQPFMVVGGRAFVGPEVRRGGLVARLEGGLSVSRDTVKQGLVRARNSPPGAQGN